VLGVFSRLGDNYQIFPEDGHRVAFAGEDVNAYSVKSSIGCTAMGKVSRERHKEIDHCRQTP
jgi:hypothetical protein